MERLGIKAEDWKLDGKKIVLLPPSKYMKAFFNASAYSYKTLKYLRPFVLKRGLHLEIREKKPVLPPMSFQNLYAIAGFNSNLLVEAVIKGIPVFASEHSVCKSISGPSYGERWHGDREKFLNHVAYSQFTIGEMRSGEAKRILDA